MSSRQTMLSFIVYDWDGRDASQDDFLGSAYVILSQVNNRWYSWRMRNIDRFFTSNNCAFILIRVINNVYYTTEDNKTEYICIYLIKTSAFENYKIFLWPISKSASFRQWHHKHVAPMSQTYFDDVTNMSQTRITTIVVFLANRCHTSCEYCLSTVTFFVFLFYSVLRAQVVKSVPVRLSHCESCWDLGTDRIAKKIFIYNTFLFKFCINLYDSFNWLICFWHSESNRVLPSIRL